MFLAGWMDGWVRLAAETCVIGDGTCNKKY